MRAGFARAAKIEGLTPAAKAFWIAGAASDDPRNELVLAVVPSDRDVEQMTSDVRFFLGGLEGASADELEHIVLPFPSQEVDPYRGLAPHLRIASARARALHAMATGQARVVVASASALLPRVSPPGALTALALDLKPGDDINMRRVAETLVDAGFTHRDPVEEHGEFCIRGGVIDIFPAGDDLPARIELVGDTIETIRRYAPETQRSVVTTERLSVVPLREVVGEPGPRVPCFDYLDIARRPVIVASEPDEIRERIEKQLAQISETYAQVRTVAAAPNRRVFGHVGDGSLAPSTPELPAPETILVSWPDVEQQLAGAAVLEELGLDEVPGGTEQLDASAPPAPLAAPEPAGRPLGEGGSPEPRVLVPARTVLLRPPHRLDQRGESGARPGRSRAVRGRDARPRGAAHRGARRLRAARREHRPRRRLLRRERPGHHRRPLARLPAAGRAAADLRRDGPVRRGAPRPGARAPIGGGGLPFGSARPQGGRPRRPRGQRHWRVRRPQGHDRRAERDDRVPRVEVRRRRQAVRPGLAPRPHPEIQRRRAALARSPRRHNLGEGQVPREEGHARHGRRAAQALRGAQGRRGPRLRARHALAGGIRGRVPLRPHRRPADRHRGHQARHGVADADGPPVVRRRGLRQDRSVDARRVQDGDGREAGGLSRAHHRARVPAREDAARALRRLSRAHRPAQPLPLDAGAEGVARGFGRRQGRHHRRHPSAALEGRGVSRSRVC